MRDCDNLGIMSELSNTGVAIISALAALLSAGLTGLLIFFIEKYKNEKEFKDNQRGITSLLLHEAQLTADKLEPALAALEKNLNEPLGVRNSTLLRLSDDLENAISLASSIILQNYKYLTPAQQINFTGYYRQLRAFRQLCTRVLDGDLLDVAPTIYGSMKEGVRFLLIGCHTISKDICWQNRKIKDASYHSNKVEQLNKMEKNRGRMGCKNA